MSIPNERYLKDLARLSEQARHLGAYQERLAELSARAAVSDGLTQAHSESAWIHEKIQAVRNSLPPAISDFSALAGGTAVYELHSARMKASEAVGEALVDFQASSRLYGGPIGEIAIAAQSSLETARMIEAASSIRADWASVYQSLAATAVATAEMHALIADIQPSLALTEWIAPLRSSMSVLAVASSDVWSAASTHATPVAPALSGWLLEAPIIQTYQASRNIVQLVTVEEDGSFETREPLSSFQPAAGTVAKRLEALGKQFLIPYRAAHAAILSKHEEYIRHAGTSLRELLDELIKHLAPDSSVKAWPSSAKLLKQNSRKARLNYLFRHVGAGAYAVFVEADINLILQTFYALNKAVHSLEEPFTEQEMQILVTRVDGNLQMLLEAAEIERLHVKAMN